MLRERAIDDISSDFEEHLLDDGGFVFAFASELFPRLEWGHFLTSLHISHALFRDSFKRWYHDGVHGLGNQAKLVEYMESITAEFNPTIALGLSRGSWAALKFGKLANVNRIIAISPHSGCPSGSFDAFPPKWHHRLRDDSGLIHDLKPLYDSGQNPYVHAYISDGAGLPSESPEVDRIMAERIHADKITFIPGYTHGGMTNLALAIRDNGILRDELLSFMGR